MKYRVELYRGAKGEVHYAKDKDGNVLVFTDKAAAQAEFARYHDFFADTMALVEIPEETPKTPKGYKLRFTMANGKSGRLRFAEGPLRGRSVVFPNPDAAAPVMADAQAHNVKAQLEPSWEDEPNHHLLKQKQQ